MDNDILWESYGRSTFFGVKIPWEHYTLRPDSVTVQKGILLINTQEVPLHRIAAKEINKNLFGQMFDCGQLRLITRGYDIPNLILKVKAPDEVADKVNEAIEAEHQRFVQGRKRTNRSRESQSPQSTRRGKR